MLDVARWLAEQGLERYVEAFPENDIDAAVLRTLNRDDLKELGVSSLGHRKKLLEAIAEFRESPHAPTSMPAARHDGGVWRSRAASVDRAVLRSGRFD